MINPIILIISILIYAAALFHTILKKPNIPLLSGVSIFLSAVYILLLYIINEKIISPVNSFFSVNFMNFFINISVGQADLSSLEKAFQFYTVVVIILFVLTVISMFLDVKRIFFEKSEI